MKKQLKLRKVKQARSTQSITRTNVQDEQYQLANQRAYYEAADAYMEGKTYLERRLGWFRFSKGFRVFYHIISVVLALITALLLTTRYLDLTGLDWPSWLLLGLTYLLVLVFFAILEWGKKEKASDVFYRLASKGEAPLNQMIYLGLIECVSLLVSALGGALIGDMQVDQTKTLDASEQQEIAKIEARYTPRLKQLSSIIAGLENLSMDSKLRRWGLTTSEQENLTTSKAERDTLRAEKTLATQGIQGKYNSAKKENQSYRIIGIGIGFGLVLFMELLTVYAYYFHNMYMKRVQAEGVQSEILPDPREESMLSEESHSTSAMIESLVGGFQTAMLQMAQFFKESSSVVSSPVTGGSTPVSTPRSEISLRPSGTSNKGGTPGTTGVAGSTEVTGTSSPEAAKAKNNKGGTPETTEVTGTPSPEATKAKNNKGGTPETTGLAGSTEVTGTPPPKAAKVKNNKGGAPETTEVTGTPPPKATKAKSNKGGTPGVTPYYAGEPLKDGVAVGLTGMSGTTNERKNGYYIPPECFEKYYKGRDRTDWPYYKLRWYEAVIPDLKAGLTYREIKEKEYVVYDGQQKRYVKKKIRDTTLRRTIVGGLKSLADNTITTPHR